MEHPVEVDALPPEVPTQLEQGVANLTVGGRDGTEDEVARRVWAVREVEVAAETARSLLAAMESPDRR